MDELQPLFQSVSRYFGLLAEPMRVRILHSICKQEKSVNQIVEETGGSQTNVSRHLSTLYSAGVLSRRKEGTHVLYAVSDETLTELCRTVCVQIATKLDEAGEEKRVEQEAQAYRSLADTLRKATTA